MPLSGYQQAGQAIRGMGGAASNVQLAIAQRRYMEAVQQQRMAIEMAKQSLQNQQFQQGLGQRQQQFSAEQAMKQQQFDAGQKMKEPQIQAATRASQAREGYMRSQEAMNQAKMQAANEFGPGFQVARMREQGLPATMEEALMAPRLDRQQPSFEDLYGQRVLGLPVAPQEVQAEGPSRNALDNVLKQRMYNAAGRSVALSGDMGQMMQARPVGQNDISVDPISRLTVGQGPIVLPQGGMYQVPGQEPVVNPMTDRSQMKAPPSGPFTAAMNFLSSDYAIMNPDAPEVVQAKALVNAGGSKFGGMYNPVAGELMPDQGTNAPAKPGKKRRVYDPATDSFIER